MQKSEKQTKHLEAARETKARKREEKVADLDAHEKVISAEKKGNTKKKDERTRNWTFLVYPESAVENWRDIINQDRIQWIESPLHDADMNGDDTEKKSHWHVLLLFDGNKSFEQIKDLTDRINSPIPQKVASVKGLVRYMVHMDNPEKAQYSVCDIKAYGGISVADLLKPTSSERYAIIREMMIYVEEKGITEMYDLIKYAMNERMDDWFPLLCDSCAYIMDKAVKSMWHKRQREFYEAESRRRERERKEFEQGKKEYEEKMRNANANGMPKDGFDISEFTECDVKCDDEFT